jgi:hypothetical protein
MVLRVAISYIHDGMRGIYLSKYSILLECMTIRVIILVQRMHCSYSLEILVINMDKKLSVVKIPATPSIF